MERIICGLIVCSGKKDHKHFYDNRIPAYREREWIISLSTRHNIPYMTTHLSITVDISSYVFNKTKSRNVSNKIIKNEM